MFFKAFSHEEIDSKMLGFSMELKDLLGTNLDLAIQVLSFFVISMLFYGK